MARKRKKAPEGGGNWMDTYGDMVTLLLTFFVMLYAMSNLNQQKWEIFVKSINPATGERQEVALQQELHDGEYEVTGNMNSDQELQPEEIGKLYLYLAQQMNNEGVSDVSLSRGNGYTFIQFQGKAFFNGDSSVLTEEGKHVLDIFCDSIAPVADQIRQIDIMGHTSQGDPNKPNDPRTDRMLSAMRSAEVTIYIQNRQVIEPEKLVGIDYGQFRPVGDVGTREGRAENRRVEILILDKDAEQRSLDEYLSEVMSGENETILTDGVPGDEKEALSPPEAGPENSAGVEGNGVSPSPAQTGDVSPE